MTQEDNRSLSRRWKERRGQNTIMEPIPFAETEILTQPVKLKVKTPGHFLSLPPMTAAIITSPTSHKQVFAEGGYKEELQRGAYHIQYVDLSERSITIPRITEHSKDGAEVSLTVSISFKVNEPEQIIKVAKPLQELLDVCKASVKSLIATHYHAELINEPGNMQYLADHDIIQFIKEKVVMNQSCRAFWVMDVIIKERHGNPEISQLKHTGLVQEKKNLTQLQNITQQKDIAEEQKQLERTKAEQDSMIKEIQALSEANRSEILKQARLLEIQLDELRKRPDMQHEQIKAIIDLKRQSLEALLRVYQVSGFPRDISDVTLVEKILSSLSESPVAVPELPPGRSEPVNELSSTIINLITPKKKE